MSTNNNNNTLYNISQDNTLPYPATPGGSNLNSFASKTSEQQLSPNSSSTLHISNIKNSMMVEHSQGNNNLSVLDTTLSKSNKNQDMEVLDFKATIQDKLPVNNNSIDSLWKKLFNVPISLDKKERVQQAIDFMEEENRAFLRDPFVTKHSLRQIAQYFNVPKSTLYDRSKAKSSKKNAHTQSKHNNNTNRLPNNNNRIHNIVGTNNAPKMKEFILSTDQVNIIRDTSRVNSTYKKYEQQMKLTIKEELELLDEIESLSYAYGTLLSTIQIYEYVKTSINKDIKLGKTWLKGFLSRHRDHIIYGHEDSEANIPVELIEEARDKYDCLVQAFTSVIHRRLHENEGEHKHVYVICDTTLNDWGLSGKSFISSFHISVVNKTVKPLVSPQLLVHDNQEIMNFSSNDANTSTAKNLIKIGKQHMNKNLHESLNLIQKCIEHFKTVEKKADETNIKPLIIYEGFTDLLHFDVTTCKTLLEQCVFMAIPWNQRIFGDILFQHLQKQLFQVFQNVKLNTLIDRSTNQLNMESIDTLSLSLDFFNLFSSKFLEECEYHAEYPPEFSKIVNGTKYINNSTSAMETNSSEIMRSYQISKSQQIPEEPIPSSNSSINIQNNNNNNNNNSNNNITDAERWHHVLQLIDKYEDHFYVQLSNQRDQDLLKDLFTNIRELTPSRTNYNNYKEK